MKGIITFVSILAIVAVCYAILLYPSAKILYSNRGQDGLISVTVKYGTDTLSYTSLTDQEFIKLVNTGKPF